MSTGTITLRVTGVRSQNPRGIGGAIFTGVPVSATGEVVDAGAYVVVKASGAVLGCTVERGQWWAVSGPVLERHTVVGGVCLVEKQVNAESATLARPSGEQIITFVAGNAAFEGFGTVKTRRLWDKFGARLYDLLDAGDVQTLASAIAIDAAKRLVSAWTLHGQSRTLQWLQAQGFDIKLGRKVLAFFGAEAQARIEEDPYRLLSFMGVWADVDRLARETFGVAANDPRRLQGAIEEACHRIFSKGHTAMFTSDLMDQVRPLLGRPPAGVRWRDVLSAAVTAGRDNGNFVQTPQGLQPLGAFVMERQVAAAIQTRLDVAKPPLLSSGEIDEIIGVVRLEENIELNPEQRSALHFASQHAFLCITGGAGVGKTTVLRSLYRLYKQAGWAVYQVALAGRAAKRMQEATDEPASTIASLLKGLSETTFDGPTVLVIDEASMVDIISMSRLCSMLPDHVRLVLVGDPHQLMPVGPGLVLHCIKQVPGIPLVELKTVKRYGGDIAAAATAIRAGRWPVLSDDETTPVAFLHRRDEEIAETVVDLLALDQVNSQILCAVRKGPAGSTLLNALCQERFAGRASEVRKWNDEFDCVESVGLRLGDKVLCKRNLWAVGLQNGSLGTVVEVENKPRPTHDGGHETSDLALAWIEWDDGERRPLTLEMLEDVELGYAITVHKAQGSQWQRVIVPVTHSQLLDRTLLYTALTRAQTQVLLVGNVAAARAAVLAQPRASERKVALDLHLAGLRASTLMFSAGPSTACTGRCKGRCGVVS